MPFKETGLPGLLIFEPEVFADSRGYFYESYNESRFDAAGVKLDMVQENQSFSGYGVIRGLHYQMEPHGQIKLVRVMLGAILDVVVDLRIGSPTFGKSFSIELSFDNKKQLYIPVGFAHGFSVLSETAILLYKCNKLYNRQSEGGILYNDPVLQIDWRIPKELELISDKDKVLPTLNECQHNFIFQS